MVLNAAPGIQNQSVWNGLITVPPLPCSLHRESGELGASPWLQLLLSALPTLRSQLGPSAPCVSSAGNVFFGLGAPGPQRTEAGGTPPSWAHKTGKMEL